MELFFGFVVWPAVALVSIVLAVKGLLKFKRKTGLMGLIARVMALLCMCFGLACLAMAAFLVLDATGHDPLGVDREIAELADKARTLKILSDFSMGIALVQSETNSNPPVEMASLVKWIEAYKTAFPDRSIHMAPLTMRDAWDKKLRIVVLNRQIAPASCGPNGVWDQGGGDDIVGFPVSLMDDPWR